MFNYNRKTTFKISKNEANMCGLSGQLFCFFVKLISCIVVAICDILHLVRIYSNMAYVVVAICDILHDH